MQIVRYVVMWCALAGVVVNLCSAQAQHANKKSGAIAAGAELYKQNCAVCHGNDGKGGAPPPASSPFTEPPPDLTALARRHDGKFPDDYVADVLRSGVKLPDHGPAEMPVWGVIFKATTKADEAEVALRIARLTKYLKSIQAK